MQHLIGKDTNEWVDLAWNWVHKEVAPGSRVFVPAGGTPQPIYASWRERTSRLLPTLKLVQIDDIATGPKSGLFKKFLIEELPSLVGNMEFIDNADKRADVSILGVGVNGHVAFHEPDLPEQFYAGCVPLTDETLKYLDLAEPTWGITYGASSFLAAKKILVLAKGERKRAILMEALKPSSTLPVAQILRHLEVTLISDFAL